MTQPFERGDIIKAFRPDTMAKDQELTVLDCRYMRGFGSGFGVQVRIGGRDVYLCSSLFYKVNKPKPVQRPAEPPHKSPFRPTWDPNDTRF